MSPKYKSPVRVVNILSEDSHLRDEFHGQSILFLLGSIGPYGGYS